MRNKARRAIHSPSVNLAAPHLFSLAFSWTAYAGARWVKIGRTDYDMQDEHQCKRAGRAFWRKFRQRVATLKRRTHGKPPR